MNVYQNNSFSGETVDLDGCAFRHCSFRDCTLRFSAAGPMELSGCSFESSRLAPAGAAQLTLDYLQGFYQGLGDWGRDTVESMFGTVRGARHDARYRAALEAFGASEEGHAVIEGFGRLPAERRRQIADLISLAARQCA